MVRAWEYKIVTETMLRNDDMYYSAIPSRYRRMVSERFESMLEGKGEIDCY